MSRKMKLIYQWVLVPIVIVTFVLFAFFSWAFDCGRVEPEDD